LVTINSIPGTFTIFANSAQFTASDATTQPLSIAFEKFVLTAISRETEENPFVYIQFENGSDETEAPGELKVFPVVASRVDDLFSHLVTHSSLAKSDEDHQDRSEWISAENIDTFLPSQAQIDQLKHLESLLDEDLKDATNENGKRQFEDADEVQR